MNPPLCTHARGDGRCNAPVNRVKLYVHDGGLIYDVFNCDHCMKPPRSMSGIKVIIITLDEWYVMQIMEP